MQIPDEWTWLLSPEGLETLKFMESLSSQDELKILTFLREKRNLSPACAALAVQQTRLRRRAVSKFPETASQMFFTPVGLEQSTDAWIAAYKASRFPEGVPVADICCGIGGDLSALALQHPVLGVDANPVTAVTAEWNLRKSQEILNGKKQKKNEPNAQICVLNNEYKAITKRELSWNSSVQYNTAENFLAQTRPEDFPSIHIDPDRRSEGVRTSQLVWFSPGLEVIEELLKGRQNAAVKLAPGTKTPDDWVRRASELEWISRDRECRELLVWFRKGETYPNGARRRATILKAHSSEVAFTICGQAGIPIPVASEPGRYIYDVDSAILAAGLEGELARHYNLCRFDEGTVFLTGQNLIKVSGISSFEIVRILPLDKKLIIKQARELGWTNPEVKKRGKVPEPDTVRQWLKGPKNKNFGTIFLVQTTVQNFAVFCKRNG